MERKTITGIVLTLLLVSMLTVTFNIQTVKAEPTTWTVDDDGPADFSSIQEAINDPDVKHGDTIFVYNGMYYEHVVLNKAVSLLGENKETTIIDGNATGTVVSITANTVVISRFTIQNSGGYPSSILSVVNSAENYITHNIIRNSSNRGIYLAYSMNNTISDNDVLNTFYGILLRASTCNNISNNTVSSNTYGIYLYRSSNDNIISANDISNTNIGVFLGPVPAGGVHPVSYNNLVSDNLVSLSGTGIMVGGRSSNSTLTDNVIEYNGWGIYLQGTRNNTMSGNDITLNNLGIYMDGWCNYTNFYHNNFVSNTEQVNNRASNYRLPISWDDGYPSGGNYWSDYEARYPDAEELDDSGIWDTPYVIDENNQDNYPLMEPWSLKPPSPVEATQELIETIETWNLLKGTENSLKAKLKVAIHMLDLGKEDGAIRKLTAFIIRVEMLREKTLTNEQADELVSEAQRIIDLING